MKAVGRGRLAMYISRKGEFTQLGVFFGINTLVLTARMEEAETGNSL